MAIKPASKPEWTVNNPDFGTVTVEPTAQKKQDGWFADERPPREFFNWLFFIIDAWIKYFEEVTDGLVALQSTYDAVIGTDGTHADFNEVMADPGIANIKRILVKSPLVVLVKQVINQPDIHIEFKPQATFTDGADLPTGLEFTAAAKRCTVLYGRFSGFDDQPGDEAITLLAGADNCLLMGNRFFSNSNDISDNADNTSMVGNIVEV